MALKPNIPHSNFHYVTFMDGVYFNKFSTIKSKKIRRQIEDIENILAKNDCNFFLNTHGLSNLLKDLSEFSANSLK